MKIIGVNVYGYGKLENLELGEISPNFQVFYGQNEAGKSTLMSFIHSILFGFPTKAHQEQRYVPKTGIKYGGKLILQTEQYGTIMIERLTGKASGDVTVYLPNGTTEGEEFLSELFRGMDKTLYQNVYSFDIKGVQGVHNLRSEDVGRFLFSSGIVGTDAILGLENKLSKDMDVLFKPNGKKPLLNNEFTKLKEEHTNILKWQEKNNEYYDLIERLRTAEKTLSDIDNHKIHLQEKMKEADRLQAIQPLLEEYRYLESQLLHLPEYEPFPEDGIKRLEQLQAQLKPYEAQLSSLQTQREEWEKSKEQIKIDSSYLENEQNILQVAKEKSVYIENQSRQDLLRRELLQIEEEIEHLKNRIKLQVSDGEYLSIDTSISIKDAVSKLVTEAERSKQQKLFLDDSFIRTKETLENSEIKLEELEKQLLPEETRRSYEEAIRYESKQLDLEKEKNYLEDELRRVDQKIKGLSEKEAGNKKRVWLLLMGIGIVFFLSGVYSLFTIEWLYGAFFIIFLLLFYPIGKALTSQSSSLILRELHNDRIHLVDRLKHIQEELLKGDFKNTKDLSGKLLLDQQIRQQIEIERATLTHYERAYEKVVANFEDWERSKFEMEENAKAVKRQLAIPDGISIERLMDVFQIIDSIKEKYVKKEKLYVQIQSKQTDIDLFQTKIADVLRLLNEKYDDSSTAIEQLSVQLNEEKKKLEKIVMYEGKIMDATERISQLEREISYINNECRILWKLANVANEEEFRGKGQANAAAKEIKDRMVLLQAQLERYQELVSICNLDTNYQNVIQEAAEELKRLVSLEKDIQTQLSDSKHRIKELEEGGTYSDFLHSFEAKKSSAKELAKKWAVHAVAKDILSKTVHQYRRVRLPMVIKNAETYFSILTEGNYTKIYSDSEEEGFIVEGRNGLRYKPNELSQATAEQLYIALRFSLAKNMHPHDSFPFIIDDSFVNFDQKRLTQAIKLIQELSKESQVLFFTCHPHVLEKCNEFSTIHLEEVTMSIQ
ncbi:AAA family ATPase [Fredinandcohnia humi]